MKNSPTPMLLFNSCILAGDYSSTWEVSIPLLPGSRSCWLGVEEASASCVVKPCKSQRNLWFILSRSLQSTAKGKTRDESSRQGRLVVCVCVLEYQNCQREACWVCVIYVMLVRCWVALPRISKFSLKGHVACRQILFLSLRPNRSAIDLCFLSECKANQGQIASWKTGSLSGKKN